MTDIEKTEIINAVIDALNDNSTNYDNKVVEPYADDVVLIMRKEGDARVGKCVTWEGISETLAAAAKSYAEASGQSASTAEEAKTNVENMKASVEQTVSDFNTLADEKKQEVQGVYQTDLNDLKGDIVNLKNGKETLSDYSSFVNGRIVAGNNLPSGYKYRVSSTDIIELKRDVTLNVADGFGIYVFYFIDGTYSKDSATLTGAVKISSEYGFKITIKRLSENTSENANISEFVNAVTINLQNTDKINELYEIISSPEKNIVNLNEHKKAESISILTRRNGTKVTNCDLRFAMITDIHSETNRMKRMIELVNSWGTFDMILNCGDTVKEVMSEGISSYNLIVDNSSVPVLNTVGNHDSWLFGTPNDWSTIYLADKIDVYNTIIKKVADTSNIVQPTNADTNGYNYYYKDFNNKVRVIVIDYMYWDSAESNWFSSVLNDAKNNSLSVMCVTHSVFDQNEMTHIESIWNTKQTFNYDSSKTPIECASIVNTFTNNGGEFIGWFVGHVHTDEVIKLHNYNNQFVLVGNSPRSNSLIPKSSNPNEYNYDTFNVIGIDTINKQIKILKIGADIDFYGSKHNCFVWDYYNHTIVNEW